MLDFEHSFQMWVSVVTGGQQAAHSEEGGIDYQKQLLNFLVIFK